MLKIKKRKILNKWVLAIISVLLFISTVTFGFISIGKSAAIDTSGMLSELSEYLEISSSSEQGNWTCSGDTISGSVTGENGGPCSSGKSYSSKLIIKYTGQETAGISFDYTFTANGGSLSSNIGLSSSGGSYGTKKILFLLNTEPK